MVVSTKKAWQERKRRERFDPRLDFTEDQRLRTNALGLDAYLQDRRRRGIPPEGIGRGLGL